MVISAFSLLKLCWFSFLCKRKGIADAAESGREDILIRKNTDCGFSGFLFYSVFAQQMRSNCAVPVLKHMECHCFCEHTDEEAEPGLNPADFLDGE